MNTTRLIGAIVIVAVIVGGGLFWHYQTTQKAMVAENVAAQQAMVEKGGGHMMYVYKAADVAVPDIAARTTVLQPGAKPLTGDLVVLTQADRSTFFNDFLSRSTTVVYSGSRLLVLEFVSEN